MACFRLDDEDVALLTFGLQLADLRGDVRSSEALSSLLDELQAIDGSVEVTVLPIA